MTIKADLDAWADGSGPLDAVYFGEKKVWPILLAPGKMSTTTSVSVSSGSVVDVVGMNPDPAYPDTVVVDGISMVVGGDGLVDILASATVSSSYASWRIMRGRGGSWTQLSNTSNSGSVALRSQAVAEGDLIKMTLTSSFSTRTLSAATVEIVPL